MSVTDEALLGALCCGGVCVRPGGCSVAGGRRPRNLLVYLDDALPALRALFEREVGSAPAPREMDGLRSVLFRGDHPV